MVEVDLIEILINDEFFSTQPTKQIVWECLTFLLAGAATVASTVMNALYYISKNRIHADRIRAETNEKVLKDKKPGQTFFDVFDYDKSADLEYVVQCFKESLRIEPPVLNSLEIECKSNVVIKSSSGVNYNILKGDHILLAIQDLHRDPNAWHNPLEYMPERWNPESKFYKTPSGTKRHPTQFIPFLGGSRNCLGQNFALLEGKFLLCYLFDRFNFELGD